MSNESGTESRTTMNWRKVTVEILGPFFKTVDENEYVALMVDTHSLWVEGAVLKSRSPLELAGFIFQTFMRFGVSCCTFVGLDGEFVRKTNLELLKQCSRISALLVNYVDALTCDAAAAGGKAKPVTTSVGTKMCTRGAPTGNSGASDIRQLPASRGTLCCFVEDENAVRTLLGDALANTLQRYTQSVHVLVESCPATWDQGLDEVLFHIRTTVADGLQHSPFYTMFEREPVPTDIGQCRQPTRDGESDPVVDNHESVAEPESEMPQDAGSGSVEPVDVKVEQIMTVGSEQTTVSIMVVPCQTVDPKETQVELTLGHGETVALASNSSPCESSARYSLRTTLNPKGKSSVVERVFRLSSAKRSLPSSPAVPNTETRLPRKRGRKPKAAAVGIAEETERSEPRLTNEDKEDASEQPGRKCPSERVAALYRLPGQMSLLKSKPVAIVAATEREELLDDTVDAPLMKEIHMKEIHLTILAEPENEEGENQRNAARVVAEREPKIDADFETDEEDSKDDELSDSTLHGGRGVGRKKKRRRRGKARKMAKELPYKCPKCIATYLATPDELTLHLQCHVPDKKLLKCPHCPKTVRNWSHLQRHLVTHEELAPLVRLIPEDKRTCAYCGKVFSTREGMLRHEQVLHQGHHRFECHACGRKYKERKTFKRHLDLHANVVYRCEECKYKTKIRRNLIEHNRIHEGRGFQCDICSKVFTKQSILAGHMEIHNTNRNPLICEQCGMKLANVGSLRQHVRNIHEQPGSFPCEHCNYVGKSKGNLVSHIERAHNKPFKCEQCDYSCKSESALKRHVDIFHNETERRFACSTCPYRARDPKQLSEHMRFRHNPNALRFACEFCSMKFKTMTMLRHHLPAHTGQHLYSCQLCGYSAKYRQTLHHHVKVKHPGQQVASVVKGTPCSEIPCTVVSEAEQLTQATIQAVTEEDDGDNVYNSPEVLISAETEPGLFVAKILAETAKGGDVASLESVNIITTDEDGVPIAGTGTIELQFITEDENGKNVSMKIVPSQEQTEKAVELLLLAMDPHQTVTEVVEETVHTTE